ncbi:MAG: ATP-binding protein [Candidatus Omnitrophica bacterium]|nr:ATP-binding protein [Candidatus Omnitrophota bacterium]
MSQENISKIGFSFDPGIIGVLGDRKYSTYSEALNEIIRNSIGYKAQKIEIEISTDKIVVRDNGLGMDLDDLTNQYFRIGRATKDATTGSLFGIGKFANQSLAHKTEIITKKQGNIKKIQIFIDWDIAEKSEEIDSLHPNAYKPEFKEIICSSEEHGTTITLTNLKYKPDIIELKRYLGKKLFPRLITNQVEILINNQKCTAMEPQGQSFAFDSTENFTLETKEVPPIPEASFGKVWGKFYLTEPDDNNALNVYDSFGHRVDIYSEKDWLKLSSKFTSGIAFKKRFVKTFCRDYTYQNRGNKKSK